MRAWRRSQWVIAAIALSATEAVPASSGPISLVPAAGQSQTAGPAAKASSNSQRPVATFKVSARMVAVQIVAQDHQGHPIPGLTACDFQVFEQVAPNREQYSQKIATVRAVNVTELAAAQSKHEVQVPSGVTRTC